MRGIQRGVMTPVATEDDRLAEVQLRPRRLQDYVGQANLKERLEIFIAAAKQRAEALDHVLLYGPPGLGKTTLAHIIAAELGVNVRTTSGPVLERPGDLAAILTNLRPGDVLFIDEIHRLHPIVEESLYPAMEDYQLDLVVGQGPSARTLKLDLPRFTLIGATTRAGLLTSPLRDRFGVVSRLDYYTDGELRQILVRSARVLGVAAEGEGIGEIGRRSRGTPRVANRLLRRVRDYAQVRADGVITRDVADQALRLFEVDELGMDTMDRTLLVTIIDKFGGGPVGIETLASAIGEERDTIEDIYEPFLMQQGFLDRTPRGRVATKRAYHHLGRSPGLPTMETAQGRLWEQEGQA